MKNLYVVGRIASGSIGPTDLILVVTGIGERVLSRDLKTNCKPHAFKHIEAAEIIRARAEVQHPGSGFVWRVVDTNALRAMQGLPQRKAKRADIPYTHADHIHRANERDQE